MQISYDPDVDAMSISLRKDAVAETKEVSPFVIVHLDKDGAVLNIELLGVSQLTDMTEALKVHGLTSESIPTE